MYVVREYVEGNVGNLSFGYLWISPIKEKNRKTPTGENVVPRKKTIRVDPNRGKQVGVPKKESPGIANPKGDPNRRQTELVLKLPRENSNKDPSGRKNEVIPRHQRQQRGSAPWVATTVAWPVPAPVARGPYGPPNHCY